MSEITIRLPRLHKYQRSIVEGASRFNVVNCGRRFGKSLLGIDRMVETVLHGKPAGWFAPNYRYMVEIWNDVSRVLKPITTRSNATERRLETVTGGVVEMWSMVDRDAGRSRKYQRVVVDEAAMVPHLGTIWQESIRATLTDYQGDAWFLSTPKGRNFFHEVYQRGQDDGFDEWRSWTRPTASNPFISESEIEAAKEELPERTFQQEYLAEFLDDAGGVFRNVVACAIAEERAEAAPGAQYVIGIDWGKQNDFTVFSVLDITTKTQVYLERVNQIDYHVQVGRLEALCKRFRPEALIPERNSIGEPLVEQLRRSEWAPSVRPFTTTSASKAKIIEALVLAFEREDISILNDRTQIMELQAFEMERLPGGSMRYGAPKGLHDDTVMALALAWHGASSGRQVIFV